MTGWELMQNDEFSNEMSVFSSLLGRNFRCRVKKMRRSKGEESEKGERERERARVNQFIGSKFVHSGH